MTCFPIVICLFNTLYAIYRRTSTLLLPRSLSPTFILIQLHVANPLNELGELAVAEILHVKIIKLIIHMVAELADANASFYCLVNNLPHKVYDFLT